MRDHILSKRTQRCASSRALATHATWCGTIVSCHAFFCFLIPGIRSLVCWLGASWWWNCFLPLILKTPPLHTHARSLPLSSARALSLSGSPQQTQAPLILSVSPLTVTASPPLLSLAAIAAGVPVVEINLDPSPISGAVTVYLHGRASETLPQLVDLVLLP